MTAVDGGNYNCVALKNDGTLAIWGYNQAAIPIGLSKVVSMSAGGAHNLAAKSDGSVVAWGENSWNQCKVPATVTRALSVSAGENFSLAIIDSPEIAVHLGPNTTGTELKSGTSPFQDFGVTSIRQTGPLKSFTVINKGTAPLNLQSPALQGADAGQFVLDSDQMNLTLNPGQSTTFTAAFKPIQTGLKNAMIQILNDDLNEGVFQIPITAVSISALVGYKGDTRMDSLIPSNTGVHNFMPTAVGSSSSGKLFTLHNSSELPLMINRMNLIGSGAFQFRLAQAEDEETILPAGDSMTFLVSFEPKNVGLHVANVQITSDDPDLPVFSIYLSGKANPSQGRPVTAWGYNAFGQCNVPPGLNNVISLAAGDQHSVALKNDETVTLWGLSGRAQSSTPAGLSGIVSIAAGNQDTLALKNDGTLVSWGLFPNYTVALPEGLSEIVDITSGYGHRIALKSDGTVVAWGSIRSFKATVPEGLRDVVAVKAGRYHCLAIKKDGSVIAWGENAKNQSNVPINTLGIIGLAAGEEQSLALSNDGRVTAWGGIGGSTTNVDSRLKNVIAVAAGSHHNLALFNDGKVIAWYLEDYYANLFNQCVVPTGLVNTVSIAGGLAHSLAAGDFPIFALYEETDNSTRATRIINGTETPRYLGATLLRNTSAAHRFTIRNDGTAMLKLGTPTLEGSDSGLFMLNVSGVASTLAPGESTTFSIAFLAQSLGVKTAKVSLKNDDPRDFEFSFNISAICTSAVALYNGEDSTSAPRINSKGVHNFPTTFATEISDTQSFTVRNAGADLLNILGITLSGTGNSHFITNQDDVNTSLAPGESTTFTTRFFPQTTGLHQAKLLIATDDDDEPLYQINIAGAATSSVGRSVVAWGLNDYGQSTAPVGLRNVVAVSAGKNHSLALKRDGTVVAWGRDLEGQCKVPTTLANVVSISAGSGHSLALKRDGTVVAWGSNWSNESTPPQGLRNVVALAAGRAHSLALKSDGSITAWGDHYYGQLKLPEGLNDGVAITTSDDYSLAIKADSKVVSWGGNSSGYIISRPTPNLMGVVAIAAGAYHGLALKSDGGIAAWGDYGTDFGQFTIPSGLGNTVRGIAAAGYHNLVLKTDGTVEAWGKSSEIQIPVPAGLKGVEAIAGGFTHNLALVSTPEISLYRGADTAGTRLMNQDVTQDLGLASVGEKGADQIFTIHNQGIAILQISDIALVGKYNSEFKLNIAQLKTALAPGESTQFSVALSPVSRGLKTCILRIYSNAHEATSFSLPLQGFAPSLISLHLTNNSSTDAMSETGVHVFQSCPLGEKSFGQSFTIRNINESSVVIRDISITGTESQSFIKDSPIFPVILGPGETIAFTISFEPKNIGLHQAMLSIYDLELSKPPFHLALAGSGFLKKESPVLAWGENNYGQCSVPKSLSRAIAVAAGESHSLALRSDGTVSCWGRNDFSQASPPAGLPPIAFIAAGQHHNLALSRDGRVFAWGSNSKGQINVPSMARTAVAIAAGGSHSLAQLTNGEIVTWGANDTGQTNVPTDLEKVVMIVAGERHSHAITTDGKVHTWGWNPSGINTPPVDLSQVALFVAGRNNLALQKDGLLKAWGNEGGEAYVPPGLGRARSLTASMSRMAIITAEKKLQTWGVNWSLSSESASTRLREVEAVALGEKHMIALGYAASLLHQKITLNIPNTIISGNEVKFESWATSGLPVTLELISGNATITSERLIANSPGILRIRASQPGNGYYKEAISVFRTVHVLAIPSISTFSKISLSDLVQNYDGRPKPISVVGLSSEPVITYAGSNQAPINAGRYPVRVTYTNAGKKTILSSTLVIEKAPLFVTPKDSSRIVGQENPEFNYDYEGFKGGDESFLIDPLPKVVTTARSSSPAGLYPITTSGGFSENYQLIHIKPAILTIHGFGRRYQSLAQHARGDTSSLLQLDFNAASTSFSAKVYSSWATTPFIFSGPLSIDPVSGTATGQRSHYKTSTGDTYTLFFQTDINGILNWTFKFEYTDSSQLISGRGRPLLTPMNKPVGYAGHYTLLLEPPQLQNGSPRPPYRYPKGSGWASGIIAASGVLNLAGVLGDGTPFTSSLSPDIDPAPGYRLFFQYKKPARESSFFSGEFSLIQHPKLINRGHVPEAFFKWSKSAEYNDLTYFDDFMGLNVVGMFDPWKIPTKSDSLASYLGQSDAKTTILGISHSTTGNDTLDKNLPGLLILTNSSLTVPDSNTNPTKWKAKINSSTGRISGTFEIPKESGRKQIVPFTAILRQPKDTLDLLLGGGHFIQPPPLDRFWDKATTGDITILRSTNP